MGDGDVALYLLIARDWLHGIVPYTGIWEYKPPGLFALYALALTAFRNPSIAADALAALAGVATTLLLWRLVAHIADERSGLLAGIFFACISIENDGLLGDAELLGVPFATAAVLVLATGTSWRRAALAGLLAACAAQMKLSFVPFAGVTAWIVVWRGGARALLPFAATFCAPFAAEVAFYAASHHLAAFWDANVGATLRRAVAQAGHRPPRHPLIPQLRIIGPALELAPFVLLRRSAWIAVLALWLAVDVATIVLIGEYDLRQFIPALAPLCALGAIGAVALADRLPWRRTAIVLIALLTFALHGYFEVKEEFRFIWSHAVAHERGPVSDEQRVVAVLHGLAARHQTVWIVEASPLLYWDAGLRPPTNYPLTSNLFDRRLWPMLGFRGDEELSRTIERTRPRWILVNRCGPWCDPVTARRFHVELDRRYILARTVIGDLRLYRTR
jgi:4-amino-4-deoxy-L-arabinose transferase-like glycosyltransferase